MHHRSARRRFGILLPLLALALAFLVAPAATVGAQGNTATVVIAKTVVGSSNVESGATVNYRLDFNCASVNDPACNSVVITDVLPAGLSWAAADVAAGTSSDVQSVSYDPATHTVTWVLKPALATGGTHQLNLQVKLLPGSLPNGSTITNVANIDGDNTAPTSDDAVVTVVAQNYWKAKKALQGTPYPGQRSTYKVQACNDTSKTTGTLNLNNASLVDTLPAGAQYISSSDGGVYNSGTNTVTWSLGNLTVSPNACVDRYVTVEWTTPPFQVGSQVTNVAQLNGTPPGGSPGASGPPATVQSTLQPFVPNPAGSGVKSVSNNGYLYPGGPVSYSFTPSNDGNVPLDDFSIADSIPSNIDITTIQTGQYNQPGTYAVEIQTTSTPAWTPIAGSPFSNQAASTTVTPALGPGERITAIRWVFGTVGVGFTYATTRPGVSGTVAASATPPATISNCTVATWTYNSAAGGPAQRCVDATLENPTARPYMRKNHTDQWPYTPGETVDYSIHVENVSYATANLVDPLVIEPLPADLTYVNASWSLANCTNAAPTPTFSQSGSTLKWAWSSYSFAPGESCDIRFKATISPSYTPTRPPSNIQNSAYVTTQTGPFTCTNTTQVTDTGDLDGDSSTTDQLCKDDEAVPVEWPTARLQPNKDILSRKGSYAPQETVVYTLQVKNASQASDVLKNPIAMELLPSGLEYGGSWSLSGCQAGVPQPLFSQTPNYNGTGRTLLRWEWTGAAAYSFAIGEACNIRLETKIGQYTPPGILANDFWITTNSNGVDYQCYGSGVSSVADANDLDGDASSSDTRCGKGTSLLVDAMAQMDSIKWVKGALDTQESRTPQHGMTTQGGSIDYRMVITNTGNVAVTNLEVIDIFPFVGDVGVYTLQPRLTQWKPQLITPVTPPPGMTVYYSTQANPCRPEIVNAPGCAAPNWTTTFPADPTTIASIKLDYGTKVIQPGESFELRWRMVAPIDGPTNGEIAWNSFAFVATRTDTNDKLLPTEPPKVGVAMGPNPKGELGDRVWIDTNKNGIQDEPLSSGVNGVKVYLYRADDLTTPIATTVTVNDSNGNPGWYLFPNLDAGNYVIKFDLATLPPNYIVTTQDAGSDNALDSDGSPVTGQTTTITLPEGGKDRTWDLGVQPSLSLGNLVWKDLNNNGVVDSGEPPIEGVTVKLYKANDLSTPIATTTTNADGHYLFEGLAPGDYVIEISNFPAGLVTSTGKPGSAFGPYEPAPDPDINEADNDDNGTKSGSVIRSAPVTLERNTEPTGEVNPADLPATVPDSYANLTVDFGLFEPLSLGNLVWVDSNNNGVKDGGEVGLDGVTVTLYKADASGNPVGAPLATQTTSNGGHYLFTNLVPGNYVVEFSNLPTGYVTSTGQVGQATGPYEPGIAETNSASDDNKDHGSAAGAVIRSTVVTLAYGTEPTGETDTGAPSGVTNNATDANTQLTVDVGVFMAFSLGNRVWYDTNNNGQMDSGEKPIAGVKVELLDSQGNVITSTTTDSNGYYLFPDLPAGTYYVQVAASNFDPGQPLEKYRNSTGATAGTDSRDNGQDTPVGGAIRSAAIVLGPTANAPTGESDLGPGGNGGVPDSQANLTVDFGFYQLQLGNLVWNDVNNNGVLDNGEQGISGAMVKLIDSNGNVVQTTFTDSSGNYVFKGFPPGTYTVEVTPPTSDWKSSTGTVASATGPYEPAPSPANGVDSDDNGSQSGVKFVSQPVTVTPGSATSGATINNDTGVTANPTVDFGAFMPMSLGNLAWTDSNNNGVKDGGEAGLDGVTVKLYKADANGNPIGGAIAVQVTSNGGHYLFTNLVPGTYVVEVSGLPAGYVTSTGTNASATGPYEPGIAETNSASDDNKDHGTEASTTVIRSGAVTLTQGSEPTGEADTSAPSGVTNNATDANTQLTVDFGVFPTLSLGNLVWVDSNNNGVKDGSEVGLDGVTVTLYKADANGNPVGAPLATQTTSNGGHYLFTDLLPGDYVVEISGLPAGYISSSGTNGSLTGPYEPGIAVGNSASADNKDHGSQVSPTVIRTGKISLVLGTAPIGESDTMMPTGVVDQATDANSQLTADFGVYLPASLGDYVWNDINGNGVQESGEPGIPGIKVELYDSAGNLVGTTTTDANGKYRFEYLATGDYTVKFYPPATYIISPPNQTTAGADSNPNPITGVTPPVHLNPGEYNPTIDAGVYQPVDLVIVKSVAPAIPGGVQVYTLAYRNDGTSKATGVVITEKVPLFTKFVAAQSTPGWSCPDGSLSGTVCTLNVGTVEAGGSGSVTFAVRIDPTLPSGTRLSNTATIGDDGKHGPDLHPENNASTIGAPVLGGGYYQLPVLGDVGNQTGGVEYVIEAQNVGSTWTKIALLLFGEAQPYCEPQVQAPFKLECTGLLKPGSSWIWSSNALSKSAKSAIAFSFDPKDKDCYDFVGLTTRPWPFSLSTLGLISANPIPPVGYFPFLWPSAEPWAGEPVAIEVVRKAPTPGNANQVMSSAYNGLSGMAEGKYDPVFGGYAFYAPVVYSGFMGMNSTLYIQNSGDECTSLELWFKAQDDCLRAMVCEVMALAPGYTAEINAAGCVPPGFIGSVWLRSTQPLGIVVDQVSSGALMSYTGRPGSLDYPSEYDKYYSGGSNVAYGPLMYREYNGWDTRVHVQNMSGVKAAKVKVYFVDHKGGIITTLVDWVCPRGEQTFFLPMVNNLPGRYVGSVRVESQMWETPGEFVVSAPNIAAVAELVQYGSAARQSVLQAASYNLIPQEQAYIWQVGKRGGGIMSGVGLLAIPSLLQKGNQLGIQTEIAIQNIVPKPGFTDFAIFVYDQNGLVDFVCEKLNEKQVEYIDLSEWGWIHPGFKGSAVISATFWEHDVFDTYGGFLRNVVGLAAVKVERFVPNGGVQVAGDVATASPAVPMPPLGFDFEGFRPDCPGQPGPMPAPKQ